MEINHATHTAASEFLWDADLCIVSAEIAETAELEKTQEVMAKLGRLSAKFARLLEETPPLEK